MPDKMRRIPLEVRTILKEDVGQRADFADEEYLESHCPEDTDFDVYLSGFETIEQTIGSLDDVRDLFLSYPSVYRTAFTRYLELTPREWRSEFGDPPFELESWELLQEYYAFEMIVDADQRESEIPSPVKRYEEGEPGTWVLAVRCDYASELSAIGYLSRNQAVAFLFNIFGYPTSRIADIVEKPEGTVSSHLSRGKSAIRRMQKAVEFVNGLRGNRPPLMKTYAELIDEVFMNNSRGVYARVINVYREEDTTESFLLGVQNSDGREYVVEPDEFLNEWERASDSDVEFPELQDFEKGNKGEYLENPFY